MKLLVVALLFIIFLLWKAEQEDLAAYRRYRRLYHALSARRGTWATGPFSTNS